MSNCLNLNNYYTDISNNRYIFNNIYDNDLSYSLVKTNPGEYYKLFNIPIKNPIGFYKKDSNNDIIDIRNIIEYKSINTDPIIIYISRGSTISYSNGDYYRFYDKSFNLININTSYNNNDGLTLETDDFYFMRGVSYEFIATNDFSSSHPFSISGNYLSETYELNNIDSSFIIYIPNDANNTNNKIFYYNPNNNTISRNLDILIDSSNIEYVYGDINFSVLIDFDNSFISIKSYNGSINNENFFNFDNECKFIIRESVTLQEEFYRLNKETLTYTSQANLIMNSNGKYYYEFNKLTHPQSSYKHSSYENIDYVLFDHVYIIFDICINYPITLKNIEFSNNIYIDSNFSYSEENSFTTQDYNYYHDSIKIIINNNPPFNLSNDSSVNIIVYNRSNGTSYEVSNNFIYSDLSKNPDSINDISYINENFILKNQKGNNFTNPIINDDIYILNRHENYYEPGYIANDKYGHNLSFLVDHSESKSFVENNDISYNIDHTINYIYSDFNENIYFNIRDIFINNDPIIEISGNNIVRNNFTNNTFYSNTFNIDTNINQQLINTLDLIYNSVFNSYYITLSDETKYYLPYEIILSGTYYHESSTYNNYIINELAEKKIISYNYPSNSINFNNINYYISDNITLDNNYGLLISNISYIDLSFGNSQPDFFLTSDYIITNNSSFSDNYLYSYLSDDNKLQLQNYTFSSSYNITGISNDLNKIFIKQVSRNNSENILNTSIQIFRNKNIDVSFLIQLEDNTNSNNIAIAKGEFKKKNLFENSILSSSSNRDKINLKYIGNYDLEIKIKGLDEDDYIYQTISNTLPPNINLDKSRIININVEDNQSPDISFSNTLIKYNNNERFIYPINYNFDILDSIKIHNINSYNSESVFESTKVPIIEISDNSIYNNIIKLENIERDLSVNFTNNTLSSSYIDTSAIITYYAIDICNNRSNDISFVIEFQDIPIIAFNGGIPEKIIDVYDSPYIDTGITVTFSGVSYELHNLVFNDNSQNTITQEISSITFDISYTVKINFNNPSDTLYNIKYEAYATLDGISTQIVEIIRLLKVQDREKPIIRLPDLSNILPNYLYTISGSTYIGVNHIEYSIENSNNFVIDFSLTYLSTFNDLSNIIYDFTIIDNYSIQSNCGYDITLNYGGTKYINFDVSNNINNILLELKNSSYLNDSSLNSSFSSLTKGNINNILQPLNFYYSIFDEFNNRFNFSRRVDIIDILSPTIKFNPAIINDINYVFYNNSIDYNDFSYESFNYFKNTSKFKEELNSIIFNYTIEDTPWDVNQSNYNITISAGDISLTNILVVDDIINSQDLSLINLFKDNGRNFEILYNIYDNQNNINTIKRNVEIITTLKPTINFVNDDIILQDISKIILEFGDICFNINDYFILENKRLIDGSDINLDLSYNIAYNSFNNIVNSSTQYDSSSLIYQTPIYEIFSNGNIIKKYIDYDISFYVFDTINSISSESIFINLELINNGPEFIVNNDINIPLIFEGGVKISDASLIMGLYAYSKYDEFSYNTLGLSYSETNFDISFSKSEITQYYFDQNNPLISNYNIYYIAEDENQIKKQISRRIEIVDTLVPYIDLKNIINVSLNKSDVYIDSNIEVIDIGSGLKRFKLDLLFDGNIINKFDISINDKEYNYIPSSILLTNTLIRSHNNFQIRYTAYDNYDNINIAYRNLNVLSEGFDFQYFINIFGEQFILDDNFNYNFKLKKLTEPLLEDISLNYNFIINEIIFEANSNDIKDFISFSTIVTYDNYIIDNNDIAVIESIIYNRPKNYKVYFQAYNNYNGNSDIKYINFNIIDNTPPDLTFITNNEIVYQSYIDLNNNIDILELPLLSNGSDPSYNTYLNISNDINILVDQIKTTGNLFYKNTNNNIVYSIPGININDIVDGSCISLSNETIDDTNAKADIFGLSVNYFYYNQYNNYLNNSITYADLSYIDPSFLLTNSGEYIQEYTVSDSRTNTNIIHRKLIVKKFPPFANLINPRDANNNEYTKVYHQYGETYYDLNGIGYDYYYKSVNFNYNNIVSELYVNNLGLQRLQYDINNNANISYITEREVHVVDINCLLETSLLDNIISSSINLKYGIYNGDYIITTTQEYPFRLHSQYDISNLIYIVEENSSNVMPYSIDGITDISFYYGSVKIRVNDDFNRVSIQYLNLDNNNNVISIEEINDTILYSPNCKITIDISNIFEHPYYNNYNNEFSVDISNINNEDSPGQYFILTDNNNITSRNLHLPLGRYKLNQNGFRNFYNPIYFSYIEDGCHNPNYNFKDIYDISYKKYEYTKNIKSNGIPGVTTSISSYIDILLDSTTPSPLYYYSKNIPRLGGKIETKNNIILCNDFISINNNLLLVDNSNLLLAISKNPTTKIFENENELKNKILLSCNLRTVDSSFANIIGITHKNINHNLCLSNNKIIFHEYQDSSNNKNIKHDISDNYLFDISLSDLSNLTHMNSNIFMYTHTKNDSNIIPPNSIRYILNVNNIFYNNNEILNYSNFFDKNDICFNEINNTNFKTKVTDIIYNNYVNRINFLDTINQDITEIYKCYENKYFSSDRLSLDSILDNNIKFELIVDILKNNGNFNTNFQTFLISVYSDISYFNINAIQKTNPSIIFYKKPDPIENTENFGYIDYVLELNDTLIDSSDNKNFLTTIFPDYSNNDLLNNRIFLNIRDICNNVKNNGVESSNNFIGLTQKNLSHNIHYDENNKLIFHSYEPNLLNYQVNYDGLTLQRTLDLSSNNNNYFLEISSNDVYNYLMDNSSNIYDNYIYKNDNQIIIDNNEFNNGYKLNAIYFTIQELSNTDVNLTTNNYSIIPQTLNKMDYDEKPYTYSIELQKTHSHSYIINFNNYFDRMYYNYIGINPYVINYSKLHYTIIDISYTNNFNMYDIGNTMPIIYDNSCLNILDLIDTKIYFINYKLNYINSFLKYNLSTSYITIIRDSQTINNLLNKIDNQTAINKFGIDIYYLYNIKESSLSIFDSYLKKSEPYKYNNPNLSIHLSLLNIRINYNINILINELNNLKGILLNYSDELNEVYSTLPEEYLDFLNNYNRNLRNIDINILEFQNTVNELYNNQSDNFYNLLNDFYNLDLSINTGFKGSLLKLYRNFYKKNNFPDIDKLYNLFIKYKNLLKTYSLILLEFQKDSCNLLNEYSNINNIFVNFNNLFNEINKDNITLFYNEFAINAVELYTDISNIFYGDQTFFINNYDISFNINNNIINKYDINFNILNIIRKKNKLIRKKMIDTSFSQFIDDLSYNIGSIMTVVDYSTQFLSKKTVNDKINYRISSDKILINSFKSNNITFKMDIYYNSSLYPNKYLDTIVLDALIPDLTPPTIIFEDDNQQIYKKDLIPGEVVTVIRTIINNISYIDTHRDYNHYIDLSINENIHDISYQNTSYKYYDNEEIINNNDNINGVPIKEIISYDSLITIDFADIYEAKINGEFRELVFTIKDNANNSNIIYKNVSVLLSNAYSIKYYIYPTETDPFKLINDLENFDNIDLIIDEEDSNDLIEIKALDNFRIMFTDGNGNENLVYSNTPEDDNIINDLNININIIRVNNIPSQIEYTIGITTIRNFTRNIEIIPKIIIPEEKKPDICCYPKVFYKAIQHNYKLGSSSTSIMRLTKIIVNNIR